MRETDLLSGLFGAAPPRLPDKSAENQDVNDTSCHKRRVLKTPTVKLEKERTHSRFLPTSALRSDALFRDVRHVLLKSWLSAGGGRGSD